MILAANSPLGSLQLYRHFYYLPVHFCRKPTEILIGIELQLQISWKYYPLNNMKSPVHEPGMSHFFRFSLVSQNGVYLAYMFLISFSKLIQENIRFLKCYYTSILNFILKMLIATVYRNTIDFRMLILGPISPLNLSVSSSSLWIS